MSWGETFIEGIFEQPAERRGARVVRLLAHVPEKWEPVLRIQHAQDQGTWSAGCRQRIPRLRAPCCAAPGYGALCGAALPQQPRDRRAQLGDAGAGARGGQQHLGIGGRMLGERRLGRGDQAREVGGFTSSVLVSTIW